MPTCTPARSALLTGLAPWNHGMLRMVRMAEQYPVEKPRVLGEAGYYTTSIGKCHYHPQRNAHGYHQLLLDESGRANRPTSAAITGAGSGRRRPRSTPTPPASAGTTIPPRPTRLPERLHPTFWTGQTAVNFIDAYNRAEPFFLKVSFARPHSPYDPPERFWKRYAEADLPPARVGKWAAKYAPRNSNWTTSGTATWGPRRCAAPAMATTAP